MLKQIITLTLATATLFALNIDVKLGKSKSEKYSVLNLESAESFRCYKNEADEAPKYSYICEFPKPPKTPFKGFKSDFFTVSQHGSGSYKLSIVSRTKSDIFSQTFDPKSVYEKRAGFEKSAKKFVIVAYEKELPFASPMKNPPINFPIAFGTDPYVYVKTLDINGLPINDAGSLQDIAQFNAVRKMYKKGSYAETIILAEQAQKSSPNSIFTSEYELLRIKSLTSLGGAANNNTAIELGKAWLKNFPDDEKASEVLVALMSASARNQDFKNAQYYFERVTGDFSFLDISKQAMIDFGDAFRSSLPKKSIELYKRALYETKEKETASLAAYKIADTYLSLNDSERAKEYYAKILKGNVGFILKDPEGAYSFAKKLAGAAIYTQASDVGDLTIDKLNKKSPSYETLLSDIGEWFANAGDAQKARSYFKRYLSEFPAGKFNKIVEARLDRLNFNGDQNMSVTELIKLADKYPKDQVGQKAIVKTLKTLTENKKYEDVLALEPKVAAFGLGKELLTEASGYILKSEKEALSQHLASNRCKEATALYAKNRVSLSGAEEPKMFDCMMSAGDFFRAYDLSKKRVVVKDLAAKLPWLYRLEASALKTGNTKEAYGAAKDVLALSKIYNVGDFSGVAFDATALALEYKDGVMMAEAANIIDNRYPSDSRSITAYKAAARLAISKNDTLSNLKYSERIYNLQNKLKIFVETPWVEFNYAAALAKSGAHKKAANIMEALLQKQLSAEDRTRALFELSSNLISAGERTRAKTTLNECIKINSNSSWKKLCQDSLEILK